MPVDQPELAKSHHQAHKMRDYNPEQFKTALSDHYLMMTMGEVMKDDDQTI